MEEETQIQDDLLVDEAPATMPLEEHATNSSVKEINPKNSKWLWFVIVMIVVLVSFGMAWYIIQENDRLSSDIEFGAVTHSEKLTSKAIKGIGNTLSEAKQMVEKNGDLEFVKVEGLDRLGINYTFEYPLGWHIMVTDGLVKINDMPIGADVVHGSGANIHLSVYSAREQEVDGTIEELIDVYTQNLQEVNQESIAGEDGKEYIKVTGMSQSFAAEEDAPYDVPVARYYIHPNEDILTPWYILSMPNDIVSDLETYEEALDKIAETFILSESEA